MAIAPKSKRADESSCQTDVLSLVSESRVFPTETIGEGTEVIPETNRRLGSRIANTAVLQPRSTERRKKFQKQCVLIRIPEKMLEQIDNLLNSRSFNVPRTTWILEAIDEKLGREVH